jgi:hypothetical protein
MVTSLQPKTPHTIKIEFADESVTSFGGLVLVEKMAARLGLWRTLEGILPQRQGVFSWLSAVKSMVLGLLSGAQGTYATQPLRQDQALLELLSLPGAPEEATVWRMLEPLGKLPPKQSLARVQTIAARRTLEQISRPSLLLDGFVPVFADGSLLEGSPRREGTKTIREKGRGLLWSAVFVGPVLCAQRLAKQGEGEQTCVRAMLEEVDHAILKPLKLHARALVLADSLHGDEPTLQQLEAARLHYLIGANKLAQTAQTLAELPEVAWEDTGARSRLGWSASGACVCWLQCDTWPAKRLLVGRRFKREGEMIWNYAGVLTDLREKDVRPLLERGRSFARVIWRLYDAKAGLETQFKDGLSDLGLHHPPCQEQGAQRRVLRGGGAGLAAGRGGGCAGRSRPGARRDGAPGRGRAGAAPAPADAFVAAAARAVDAAGASAASCARAEGVPVGGGRSHAAIIRALLGRTEPLLRRSRRQTSPMTASNPRFGERKSHGHNEPKMIPFASRIAPRARKGSWRALLNGF